MIGNDIIDRNLSCRESDWKRPGWINRIYTRGEQAFISAASIPDLHIWLMWSMKEAAYKVCNRLSHCRSYAPQRWVCREIDLSEYGARGKVMYNGMALYTNSIISRDFIHTSAALHNNWNRISVFIANLSHAGVPAGSRRLFFKDSEGLPYLIDPRSGRVSAVSISHHGSFEAFVLYK